MTHTRHLFLILLVREVYGLNSSPIINVDDMSSISLNSSVTSLQRMNDPAAIIFRNNQTLNNISTGTNSNLYMLNLSEATGETIEFDVLKKIEYYNNFAARIWRIFPPILLGKKTFGKNND